MRTVALAVLPIFFLILMGWTLHRYKALEDGFWAPAEKLAYYVFFPALLFRTTSTADLPFRTAGGAMAAGGLSVLAVAAAMALARRFWRTDGPAFTSYFQGTIRPNTYIGLAVAEALFGGDGMSLIAAQTIVVIPLVNVLAVSVLIKWGDPARPGTGGVWSLVRPVAANPLILACLAGGGCNALGFGPPPVAASLLEILSRAALPIALLATGAGLDFKSVSAAKGPIFASCVIKLLILPALAAAIASILGVTGAPLAVVAIYGALPVSASSYVLSRQLGGDTPLMAGIITASTIASAVTIPTIVLAMAGRWAG